MSSAFFDHVRGELRQMTDAGLYKEERLIMTPQGATVRTAAGREVINLCANNYLGLSSHPAVIDAARETLRTHGYGLSSVRFICGTQDLHKILEARLSDFLGTEDTILYAAAFDANGGLFEPLLGPNLGKALGGASGGFTSGRREVIELLRQRSRPYLFSNALAPSIVGATLAVLDLLEFSTALRDKLEDNTRYFRRAITAAGFNVKPGEHPIVPIMVYDGITAQRLAARLLGLGIYVVGFFFPVVPQGQARIRVQLSASHARHQLDTAVAAFAQAGHELGLLS